ncbi:hypothetical protein [Streptomyces sp. NPDC008121]|uniref:hypothetical protein n=1 Tax=Streptomyces sp. NPDC008121 TaxID=3364809 RepID=UPI0036E078D4
MVETRYGETVQKITMGPNWSGVSAGTAQTNFTGTRFEYSAAQTQAKAIASLLRDAHEKFTDLKKKLQSARRRDSRRNDRLGTGTRRHRLLQAHRGCDAYHRDPDHQTSARKAVSTWQQHIEDWVKAVSETDEHVKTALSAAVVSMSVSVAGAGRGGTG